MCSQERTYDRQGRPAEDKGRGLQQSILQGTHRRHGRTEETERTEVEARVHDLSRRWVSRVLIRDGSRKEGQPSQRKKSESVAAAAAETAIVGKEEERKVPETERSLVLRLSSTQEAAMGAALEFIKRYELEHMGDRVSVTIEFQ